jgi:type VI protein secretion system component Hcp
MRSRLFVSFCLLALAAFLPLQAQVIQGCVDNNKGDVRILKAGQTCDSAKEYAVSWSIAGTPGANGANGRDGRDGTAGAAGAAGRDGLDCDPAAPVAPKQVGTITFTDSAGTTGAIPIYEVDGGVENPTTIGSATGGAGAGKVKYKEFRIIKRSDAASSVFFRRSATGTHFTEAVIDLSTTTTMRKLTLGTVFITGFDVVSVEGSAETLESITFVFGKLKVEAEGGSFCWDQITNTSC